jgi:hypothetical protein
VRGPGDGYGLVGAWKNCVLDTLRTRDVRCGKELLWESEWLPSYRVSDACRAHADEVGAACKTCVKADAEGALPSASDVASCRDAEDSAACDRALHALANPLYLNHGGVLCDGCGRVAKYFQFGTSRPAPVPATPAFTQPELDAIYTRLDTGLGAVAMRRCAHPRERTDCHDLQDMIRFHPSHADAATWRALLARMHPTLDALWWANADTARCIRQRDDADDIACAELRNYLELFPAGLHATDAQHALTAAEPVRAARLHAEAVEMCKRTCTAPPIDWRMGPGPEQCTKLLGYPC